MIIYPTLSWMISMALGHFFKPMYYPLIIKQVTIPIELGEGPHWDVNNNVLYYVDIFKQNIYCYDPVTSRVTTAHLLEGPVTVIVPVAGKYNTFVVGCGTSLRQVYWDTRYNYHNPPSKMIAKVDYDRLHTRFNDGKVDPRGRFWAGTMGQIKDGQLIDYRGSLYRFDYNGTPTKILHPVSISNGLVWNHNNDTFYYADSRTLRVDAYDYDQFSGNIFNKRTIFNLVEHGILGMPDGITIDTMGNLWIAITEGGMVIEIDPRTGELRSRIELPVTKVNSVAFGGYNLDILYVTTAKRGLTNEELVKQPLAGSVFSITGHGAKGTPMRSYILK